MEDRRDVRATCWSKVEKGTDWGENREAHRGDPDQRKATLS